MYRGCNDYVSGRSFSIGFHVASGSGVLALLNDHVLQGRLLSAGISTCNLVAIEHHTLSGLSLGHEQVIWCGFFVGSVLSTTFGCGVSYRDVCGVALVLDGHRLVVSGDGFFTSVPRFVRGFARDSPLWRR